MVQKTASLAMPQLPESRFRNRAFTIKKKSPNILLVINFFSPDGRYDDIYLSNYATIFVKDEVFRLEGVGDIVYLGNATTAFAPGSICRNWRRGTSRPTRSLMQSKTATSRPRARSASSRRRQPNLSASDRYVSTVN